MPHPPTLACGACGERRGSQVMVVFDDRCFCPKDACQAARFAAVEGSAWVPEDDGRGHSCRVGERNASAKLTEAQVLEIRAKYAPPTVRYRALGREYGVSDATIGDIIRGASWTHLGAPQPQR